MPRSPLEFRNGRDPPNLFITFSTRLRGRDADEEPEGDTPGEVLQRVREVLSRRALREEGVREEEVHELRQALLDLEAGEEDLRRLDLLALHLHRRPADQEEARLHLLVEGGREVLREERAHQRAALPRREQVEARPLLHRRLDSRLPEDRGGEGRLRAPLQPAGRPADVPPLQRHPQRGGEREARHLVLHDRPDGDSQQGGLLEGQVHRPRLRDAHEGVRDPRGRDFLRRERLGRARARSATPSSTS